MKTTPSRSSLEIYDPHIIDAQQALNGLTPVPTKLNIEAPDVKLSDKAGYIVNVRAKIGLSGGPMVDAIDDSAVGICSFGLPPDATDKTQIGVVDLRQIAIHLRVAQRHTSLRRTGRPWMAIRRDVSAAPGRPKRPWRSSRLPNPRLVKLLKEIIPDLFARSPFFPFAWAEIVQPT